MKRLPLLLTLLLLLANLTAAQSRENAALAADSLTQAQNALRFDLQALEARAAKLSEPLAGARARAEIAAAAWALDADWAKRLLREAYELTLPPEAERARLRALPAGTRPQLRR